MIVAAVVSIVALVPLLAFEQSPWPAAVLFLMFAVLGVYVALVAYRKELYIINDTRVIRHSGGMFSDQTTELEMRNITHLKIKLPWLRHKLFGIGNVMVESAGTSQPLVMMAIRQPNEIYEGFRNRLQRNGFDLTRNQLLHEDKPALIGIMGEMVVGAVAMIVFVVPTAITMMNEFKDDGFGQAMPLIFAFSALVFLMFFACRVLDYKRRTYRVYNDVVVYEEGFLTRQNAYIPYENIADSNTKRTLFDQIFGIYDVHISCQGSSSEIKFRRLKNGDALSRAIDQLVTDANRKPKPAARRAEGGAAQDVKVCYRREEPDHVPVDAAIVGEFKMHAARVYVPMLFFVPLFPLWVLIMIQSLIRVTCTSYSLRPGSMRHAYRFLSTNVREFSYDKITGLVIKRNLWDRMFGTMTLRFWSIGSSQSMEFAHVHESQIDLPALMRQAGIPPSSPAPYQAKVSFMPVTWARANMGGFITTALFIAIILIGGAIISSASDDAGVFYLVSAIILGMIFIITLVAFIRAFLYFKRQTLSFHEHHVEGRQGILSISDFYIRYRHIKRTKITRYPGGEDGSLEIFAAGEELAGAASNHQQAKQKGILKQYSFVTHFLPGAWEDGALLDDILSGRADASPQPVPAEPLEPIWVGPRALKNAIVKLLIVSVVVFPLVILLPITLPLTVMRVKRWRYTIDGAKISVSHGILYRSKTSTLLDRVDSLQQNQGPLNKMFNNGNVTIMTAGSSKPDVAIIDTPDYRKMYDIIRESTQSSSFADHPASRSSDASPLCVAE